MKTLVITLILANTICEIHCTSSRLVKPRQTTRLGDAVNLRTVKQTVIHASATVKSKIGNALISLRRIADYASKRFVTWLKDEDFVLDQKDAAYHFQEEQEPRDQAIALIEEELSSKREQRDAIQPKFSLLPWKWKIWTWTDLLRKLRRGFQFMMLNWKIGKIKEDAIAGK